MTNKTRQRLLDALESCQTIRHYTAGTDLPAYLRDDKLRDAVERRLGIVGEALHRVTNLDPTLAAQIPDLRQIVGLRNRLIHGYAEVNDEIVWNVVQNLLPSLENRLVHLIEEAPQD